MSDDLQYFYSILVKEGLADWKIKIAADGYCWFESKTIQIPEQCGTGGFLHEVTHALEQEPEPCGKGLHFHGAKWGDRFTLLVDKYMRFDDRLNRRADPVKDRLADALFAIVHDLPMRRDWLDPVIEKKARAALADYEKEKA